jgi:hypothetical protein
MNKEQSELETQLLILGIPAVRVKKGKEDKDIDRLIKEISNSL